MTVGLAYATADEIVLAIECLGVPCSAADDFRPLTLTSKIVLLQSSPTIAMLVCGGIEHWAYVVGRYREQATIQAAVESVAELVNECTKPGNEAFSVVCGFENGQAKCGWVDRGEDAKECGKRDAVAMDGVVYIGRLAIASAARTRAEELIAKPIDCLRALVIAIEEQAGSPYVRLPVHVRRILRSG